MTNIDETIRPTAGRREFLTRLGSAGIGVAAGTIIAGCGGGSNHNSGSVQAQSTNMDGAILNAAATAEAIAITMYYHIITSPIYSGGGGNAIGTNAPDQAYLVAAYEQEISHYNTLVGAGATSLATTNTFYFPNGMFSNSSTANLQTTIDTLSILEDAFIAAYLFAVGNFSTTANKVLAAQIMGVESEHRALARVIAHDVGLTETATFAGGTSSVVTPTAAANDVAYEHTYGVTSLSAITTALTPFISLSAATTAGYSTVPYTLSSATTTGSGSQIAAKTLTDSNGATITPVTLDPTAAPGA